MDNNLFTSDVVTSNRILYTPSLFARNALLHLQEIGSLTAHTPHVSSRNNLQSYLFFIVVSGSGELIYDGNKYELHGGDCVFIDCEKPYSHLTYRDDLWTLTWIHFYGYSMQSIYDKYIDRGGRPVFNPSNVDDFIKLYKDIFSVAASDDYIRDMRINSLLSQLLVLLMEKSWDNSKSDKGKGRKDFLAVKNYLDEHYADKISLDDLSKMFYINKYYLVKSFKIQFGVSINTYLRDVRITMAKRMLRFSDKKIESIGNECGLGELTYFSRTFKAIEGISPTDYRKMWSGMNTK